MLVREVGFWIGLCLLVSDNNEYVNLLCFFCCVRDLYGSMIIY